MPFATHADYLATQPEVLRARLMLVQQEIARQVPGATACVGYNLPAYKQRRIFIYFAAFTHHIGIYPPVTHDRALIEETARFRGPKGNLSFRHDQELPLALIGRIAKALAAQYAAM